MDRFRRPRTTSATDEKFLENHTKLSLHVVLICQHNVTYWLRQASIPDRRTSSDVLALVAERLKAARPRCRLVQPLRVTDLYEPLDVATPHVARERQLLAFDCERCPGSGSKYRLRGRWTRRDA